ncbi:MAG: hypothetical protein Q9174_002967 [Haloplaca sp. 1 TL-2023]
MPNELGHLAVWDLHYILEIEQRTSNTFQWSGSDGIKHYERWSRRPTVVQSKLLNMFQKIEEYVKAKIWFLQNFNSPLIAPQSNV